MDFLLTTDKNYVKYLIVVMASVYENHKNFTKGLTFHILYNNLDSTDFDKISLFANKYGEKVYFYYVDDSLFKDLPVGIGWPVSCMYILLAHKILPETLHRVLYLDIDLIVNGNLEEFYELDFDDNYLIVSKDWYDARYEPEKSLTDFDYVTDFDEAKAAKGKYFNSGVVLFNLDKFRAENIDINFYREKLKRLKNVFFDQGILGVCFAKKSKLLRTCRYNYRIGYSMISFDRERENFYYNSFYHYKFCAVNPYIIHYTGYRGFKPWMMHFTRNEINANLDFRDICEEYADYVDVWWKYARLCPNFDELWETQQKNKSAYRMVKLLIRHRPGEFAKNMYLDTLNVPDYFGRSVIQNGDDLNRYVKPGVYACDASTKKYVKNLPSDLTEATNFRLTVKALSVGAAYTASLVQELEVADKNASLYRRYAKNRNAGWSPWARLVTSDNVDRCMHEISAAIDEAEQLKEIQREGLSRFAEATANFEKNYRSLHSQLNILKDEMNRLNGNYYSLKNSFSFKLGRFITFIPRKIRDLFKKKK